MATEYIVELEINLPDRDGVPVPDSEIIDWGKSLGCHTVEFVGTSDAGNRIFDFKAINRELVENIGRRVLAADEIIFDPDTITETTTDIPDHYESAKSAIIFPSHVEVEHIFNEEGQLTGAKLPDGRIMYPGDYLDRRGVIQVGGSSGIVNNNPHDYETSLVTSNTHVYDGSDNDQIEATPADGMPGWTLPDIEIPDDWFEDLTGYDEQIPVKE